MAWVTRTDVTTRYEGDISPEQGPWVDSLITEAEQLLRDLVPDVDDRITAGVTSLTTVQHVVRASTLRIIRNPGGLASEASGEYSYRRNDTTGAEAAFTPREIARVTGSSRRRRGTIYARPAGPWQSA